MIMGSANKRKQKLDVRFEIEGSEAERADVFKFIVCNILTRHFSEVCVDESSAVYKSFNGGTSREGLLDTGTDGCMYK
jgi:hypothetical protein